VLHAITDAIFGALAEGDIGTHFPPDDDKWKDASSDIFLKYAQKLAKGRNFIIGNVDCTVICEKPKIKPHAELIKTNIQNILNLNKDRVSIKATTSEKLGFTGREEGIAALATVTLIST
jgi:2-C-methyl-D-erythritol 4-phosphate cytidylyltransferase/2-C-methyl-D-erythritol 2,4-cyclodiphosphate synthase